MTVQLISPIRNLIGVDDVIPSHGHPRKKPRYTVQDTILQSLLGPASSVWETAVQPNAESGGWTAPKKDKMDNGDNKQDRVFGYYVGDETIDSTDASGLLNSRENGFLDQFFDAALSEMAQQPTQLTHQTGLQPYQTSGRQDLEELDWLTAENAPNLHSLGIASHPGHLPTGQMQAVDKQEFSAYDNLGLDATGQIHDGMGTAGLMAPPMPLQNVPAQTNAVSQALSGNVAHSSAGFPQLPQLSPTQAMQAMQSISPMAGIHTTQALPEVMSRPTELERTVDARAQTYVKLYHGTFPTLDTTSDAVQNVMSDGPHTAPPTDSKHDPRLFRFGTDEHFSAFGFTPKFEAENHEARAEYLTVELKRLRPINRSPTGTRTDGADSKGSLKRRRASAFATIGSHPLVGDDDGGEEDQEGLLHLKRIRTGAGSGTGIGLSGPTRPVASTGRRASSGEVRLGRPGPRTGRDPLTEQQKRQNHILSEQKRRNQIKEGYAEMERLVPGLNDGNLSKSNMLNEAADYLRVLRDRNAAIVQRIQQANEQHDSQGGGV
jgi:hypothetical protein